MSSGDDPEAATRPDRRSSTWGRKLGWLAALLGLTGFAVSQPLLAVAGDDPTLFTFAGVAGRNLVVFALVVALVPPLAMWLLLLIVDRFDERAARALFLGLVGLLAGAAVTQWVWTAGVESRWVRVGVWIATAIAVPLLVRRFKPILMWIRYTAVLPVLAIVLFLASSPSSGLLEEPTTVTPSGTSGLPSVVFVMLDEFPLKTLLDEKNQIDAVRFPNLAAFAGQSTWYRDYTAMATETLQSVPAILSGSRPTMSKNALWTAHPDNLFSLLAPTHDLTVSETATRLCGFSNCGLEGTDQDDPGGLGKVFSTISDIWRQRTALSPYEGADLTQFEATVEPGGNAPTDADSGDEDAWSALPRPSQVTEFIDALGSARDPSLAYLHVMLPHQPWQLDPDGNELKWLSLLDLGISGIKPDDWDEAMMQQAHIFQAQYTDRLVGQVLDRLRELGRFDDSLIVITADHGVSFHANLATPRSLRKNSISDLAHVPLFVKSPGQTEAHVDDSNLMSIDLLPTIASILGIEIPWDHPGLPSGDPHIGNRGTRKEIIRSKSVDGADDVVHFDSRTDPPRAKDRAVGSIAEGDDPLAGLFRPLGGDRWLGRPSKEWTATDPIGTATVDPFNAGRVGGHITSGPTSGTVALAVNGKIRSMSPVQEGGRISLFISGDVAKTPNPRLDLFLVRGDELTPLDIT